MSAYTVSPPFWVTCCGECEFFMPRTGKCFSTQKYRGYNEAPCQTVKNKNIENRERWEAERRKYENEAAGNGGDG